MVEEDIQGVTQKNIEFVLAQEEAVRRNAPEIYRLVHRMATICGSLVFLGLNLAWFTGCTGYNMANQSFVLEKRPICLDACLYKLAKNFER